MADGIVLSASARSRDDLCRRNAVGVFAETCQLQVSSTGAAVSSGRAVSYPVYLFAGEVVTNIVAAVVGAGSGLTLVKLGIYTNVTLVASTADVKAAFASVGRKVSALSTPYTVPSDGVYRLAYLATHSGGATPTVVMSQVGNSDALPAISGGVDLSGQQTGQSDLPGTATWATGLGQFVYLAVN